MSFLAPLGMVAGTAMQVKANRDTNKDISGALQGDLQTQKKYQQQAMESFYRQLAATSPSAATSTLGEGAAHRQALYGQVGAAPLVPPHNTYGTSGNPSRDAALYSMLGDVRSKLGAYGDLTQSNVVANQQAAQELSRLTNFAAGQHSLLPYDLYQAQHRQDWLRALGQLVGMGGAAMGMSAGAPGATSNPSMAFATGEQQTQGNFNQQSPQVPPMYAPARTQQPSFATQYGPMGWLYNPQQYYTIY